MSETGIGAVVVELLSSLASRALRDQQAVIEIEENEKHLTILNSENRQKFVDNHTISLQKATEFVPVLLHFVSHNCMSTCIRRLSSSCFKGLLSLKKS